MAARIERWAAVTATGDLAEVPGLTDGHPLWPQVTSTRDNCLGQRCSEYARCHLVAARREAQEADLVIVNHHLLLADLALKEDGFGDLLGTADAVILDEAHQLPDLATQFFGVTVGSRQLENLLAEARAALLGVGASLAVLGESARKVESAIGATLGVLPRGGARRRWEDSGADLESFVLGLAASLRELGTRLEAGQREAEVAQVATRAGEVAASLERIALCGEEEGARTVESTGRNFTLGLLPFDIAERFSALVTARPTAWVFTSATLSVGADFSHFATRLGVQAAQTVHIPSPFDYENQAMLYLPEGMPEPSDPGYVAAVVEKSLPLIEAADGGAFLLFTSHRALAAAAALLRERWEWAADLPVLVQGESPRERLLQRVPRERQRAAARHLELLGRRRRQGRGAAPRDHREAAVRVARRSARQGAHRSPAPQRRQSVPRLPAARGRDRAEAGLRPPDPQRGRPRRHRDLRPAAARQELWPRVSSQPAADARDA